MSRRARGQARGGARGGRGRGGRRQGRQREEDPPFRVSIRRTSRRIPNRPFVRQIGKFRGYVFKCNN